MSSVLSINHNLITISCINYFTTSNWNLALQAKQSTDNRVRNLWLDTLDDDCLTSEDDYEEEDVDAEDQDGGGANDVDVSGDKHIWTVYFFSLWACK